MHLFMCMYVYVHADDMCVHACGDQRPTSDVLHYSLPYSFEPRSSLIN